MDLKQCIWGGERRGQMYLQAFKHKTFKIARLNFSALNIPTANVMVHS